MSLRYLNKQIFRLDSHNRTNGTHNDFYIDVDLAPNKEVDTVCILRASVKKSYWIVEDGYNTFILQEGAQQATITVPPGNYSADSFKYVVAGLLNTASLTMSSYTYTITIPSSNLASRTGRFTYTSTGSDSAFVISFNLFEQLGFNPNQTVSFVNGTITSETGLNFQVKSALNIHTDMIANNKNNILVDIQTTGSDFTTLTYECLDIEANSEPLNVLTGNYRFTTFDEDHQPVDLTLNVLITLIVYKKNDILDKLAVRALEYIEYLLERDNPLLMDK